MLTFDEFNKVNVKRCVTVFHPVDDWSEADWATALAGEVGELCNMIKKRKRGEDIPVSELGKELGDIIAYADLMATKLGLNLGEETKNKFNEISDRHDCDIKL